MVCEQFFKRRLRQLYLCPIHTYHPRTSGYLYYGHSRYLGCSTHFVSESLQYHQIMQLNTSKFLLTLVTPITILLNKLQIVRRHATYPYSPVLSWHVVSIKYMLVVPHEHPFVSLIVPMYPCMVHVWFALLLHVGLVTGKLTMFCIS